MSLPISSRSVSWCQAVSKKINITSIVTLLLPKIAWNSWKSNRSNKGCPSGLKFSFTCHASKKGDKCPLVSLYLWGAPILAQANMAATANGLTGM